MRTSPPAYLNVAGQPRSRRFRVRGRRRLATSRVPRSDTTWCNCRGSVPEIVRRASGSGQIREVAIPVRCSCGRACPWDTYRPKHPGKKIKSSRQVCCKLSRDQPAGLCFLLFAMIRTCTQGRIQPVSLGGGAISIIFGSQSLIMA